MIKIKTNKNQKSICFYFQVHQPYRLSETYFFEENAPKNYFEGPKNVKNKEVFEKVAQKCYIPATTLILELLKTHLEFRVTYSFSGTFLDQCEEYGKIGKTVLDLFKKVVKTGQVEVLSETSYHSLSFLYSKEEFAEQIKNHTERIQKIFGVMPRVFRNTELIYNNEVGEFVRQLGFEGMLAEGWEKYLEKRSPNFLYTNKKVALHKEDQLIAKKIREKKKEKEDFVVFLKNYRLSDDIAFRFGNKQWESHPLTCEKFAKWVSETEGEVIHLFMDYETLGEHQWEDTGIFTFLKNLPEALIKKEIGFKTPSEELDSLETKGIYDVPFYLSWADSERDLSAWLENEIQKSALQELSHFEKLLHAHKKSKAKEMQELIRDFRRLQTSDHLYYMCTKYWNDGDVHKYFSPYSSEHSPYEAYIHFMNTIRSLHERFKILISSSSKNGKKRK